MLFFFIYLISGIIIGVVSGLLGIGGGIIVVPLLAFLLPLAGIPSIFVVHIAVATSLATVMITGSSATFVHNRHRAIDWHLVRRLIPLLIIGVVIGTMLAAHIPGYWLAKLIAVMMFIIGVKMLLKKDRGSADEHLNKAEPQWRLVSSNIFFGMLSAMFGVGGGTFLIPYLHGPLKKTMPQSVAISSACLVGISLASTVAYMVVGYDTPGLPAWTTGFIYWPALVGIGIASVASAPFGAQLAHKLPAKQLRYIFAALLFVAALKMAI